MGLPLFGSTKDRKLMEQFNKEMYELYMHDVAVYKLNFHTGTENILYHEDINRDIPTTPTYIIHGYSDVTDNGLAALYKQGQKLDRQIFLYFSRKLLEDYLKSKGWDLYDYTPADGDVVNVQGYLWEVMNADPEGFHMNQRDYPFDYQFNIVPWQRTGTPKTTTKHIFERY